MRFTSLLKRVVSAAAASSLVGAYLVSALLGAARPTFAAGDAASSSSAATTIVSSAYCRGLNTALSPDVCEGLNEAANQVDDKIIKPATKIALLSAFLNLVTTFLDRIAYESAIWISTGGEGETPLFNRETAADAWSTFGLDIAATAIDDLGGALLDQLEIDFDICAPTDPLFKLTMQLGLKQAYQPSAPDCSFQDLRSNWDSFISSTVGFADDPSNMVLKAFADGFRPGRNELSAVVGLNLKVHERTLEKKTNELYEMVNSGGFKSVTDIVTGQVKTPSSVLQDEFNRTLERSEETPTDLQAQMVIQNSDLIGNMFMHVAGVFTNTLLSSLMNQIYTGFFDVTPMVDPFDVESVSILTVGDAANRYASLMTTLPTRVDNYSFISEFVACPVGPVATRGLNNCVMDSNFVTAVSRAESGTPMTVQEAIDEGLLNGDWPLIPYQGDGITQNQDPLCYTYGYCYGNLVKLRKARIIPVGWEIAASRNNGAYATLQEIVDGFNNCGEQEGGIDSGHQWCHLIDPDWVLKYPETQCRALVNGELQISTLSPGRAGACTDAPSCISESNDGSCDGGFGYCERERNVWRFRGEECPEQYASCLSFENTFSGDSTSLLFNTVDQDGCNADNAGCEWYRTNKYFDDNGTPDDASDDAYEWLPGDEGTGANAFLTADRANDIKRYDVATSATLAPASYAYDTDGDSVDEETYDTYSYQDRIYFNNNVEECAETAAGCSAVYQISESLALNVVQNPSFEDDAEEDGVPDSWTAYGSGGTLDNTRTYSYYGDNAYSTSATGALYQPNIQIAPGNFYTFSYYARQARSGGADRVSGRVVLRDADGNYLNLAGTSTAGDCAVANWAAASNNSVLIDGKTPAGTDHERFECIFTVPDGGNGAMAEIWLESNGAYVDSVQLELGEDASGFVEGYNASSPSTSYLLVPPDYLGCTGASTDPAECEGYTQVCQAQDVGCNLYAPEDGDPSVPAIASALDECPSECVGYAAFKQEATDREDESFPLYFIADKAESCSSQYVGCDSFTNLDAVSAGGEGSEAYTYLRACVKPEMAAGDAANNESSTYFTWEGSDAAGYQLVTWVLLKSDDDAAPCVSWDVRAEDELVCAEDASVDYETDDCDQHADIFDNPNCREFYDEDGDIHYRDVTLTVAVDSDCHPYRMEESAESDCEGSGGFWTDAGDCRYFGLAEESAECPVAQAGCREYTGGAGRNATTVFSDDFEDGDLMEYSTAAGAAGRATISNESIATDGHSMRVATVGSLGTVSTYWTYLDSGDASEIYEESDATTCTSNGGTVDSSGNCEMDPDGDGTVDCSIEDGDNGCGTLDDLLLPGKTFTLSFWAKGSADILVYFADAGGTGSQHDFVSPETSVVDRLAVEGAWQSYELGPIDTTAFASFDDSSVLRFAVSSGETLYLDNVRLKSVEENVTLIKDSWIVPSTCDQTPDGAASAQYYLGCEAYTDQDGNGATLYQFSDLCSEDVVGCDAFYDTQNSDSSFGMVYNARCQYVSDVITDDDTVGTNTACVLEGKTACTISAGESFCLYDREGAIPSTLPWTAVGTDGNFYMALGPEAAVVDSDIPRYLVDNGTASCTSENVGCEEIGVPTYSQDKTSVTALESAYYINDPDSYGNTLCGDDELFCEEWSSTQDGNFYFKDPVDQTCEYKTGVGVSGSTYFGWFRTGTNEPCYPDYVVAGEELGIWRNGDDGFAGWAGSCPASYDLCTEFRDISDSSGTLYPAGTPYYFFDDSSLSEESLTASEQCEGQVSQKEGCGLFYDTTDSELKYNTTASYVASVHADDLFGDAPGSKQDPISCENGGEPITTPSGEVVNLCETRCYYDTEDDDEILTPNAQEVSTGRIPTVNLGFLERSCYVDADCPTLETANGEDVVGTCVEPDTDLELSIRRLAGAEDPNLLSNDANRTIRVYRDRECSAWISCQSAQVSWNPVSSRYESICDKVGLCTQYSRTGDSGFCTKWEEDDPIVLDAGTYAGRDTTWNGSEYSGFSIPYQLPVSEYDQINVSPDVTDYVCVESSFDSGAPPIPLLDSLGDFKDCEGADDTGDICADEGDYVCRQMSAEYRLGYIAGSCSLAEAGWLGSCVVGFCQNTGDDCSDDGDCLSDDSCVVGYCQGVSAITCSSDSDCDSTFPVCDTLKALCVDRLAPNDNVCVTASDCPSVGTPTCTPDALSKNGSCVNGMCATDINGDPLSSTNAEAEECRGYPETTSPFPTKIVTEWSDPTNKNDGPSTMPEGYDWRPYSFNYGFETASTCSPIKNQNDEIVLTDDCVCSYDKVSYGTGGQVVRYYPIDSQLEQYAGDNGVANTGICVSGDMSGQFCTLDEDCLSDNTYTGGSCARFERVDDMYGWNGYCIERDVSIQKNGSSTSDDQACVSWFPVDQLAGSTDLYGKYMGAGYNDGDTYYCAEVEVGYVIKPGEAGRVRSNGDCTASPAWSDSGCQDGMFPAVWGCYQQDDSEYYWFNMRCIPENSYHAGDLEDECTHYSYGQELSGDEYADCETPVLLTPSQVYDWIGVEDDWEFDDLGFWYVDDLIHSPPTDVVIEGRPYCKQVVKTHDSYSYNYAWTDRVFAETGYTVLEVSTEETDEFFHFSTTTSQQVFGKADDVTLSQPIDTFASDYSSPLSVLMCRDDLLGYVLPDAVGFCETGTSSDAVINNARAYEQVEINPTGYIVSHRGNVDELHCKDWEGLDANLCDEGVDVYCDTSSSRCVGGIRDQRYCENDRDCQLLTCVNSAEPPSGDSHEYTGGGYSCVSIVPYVDPEVVQPVDNIVSRLQQFFAKSISLPYGGIPWYSYSSTNGWTNETSQDEVSDFGAYEQMEEEIASWDVTATGDPYSSVTPDVPVIVSVGSCDGTECEEGNKGKFSVNGIDGGTIEGADGYKFVTVNFFAYADADQMPIRNIIVDWGFDFDGLNSSEMSWPTGTQSGSPTDDNYYQNHRGYQSNGEPYCKSDDGLSANWSESPDACDSSYVTFTNAYTCSAVDLTELPTCTITTDPNGNTRLVSSPCTGGVVPNAGGACVFQPRVHIRDNWGWCMGYCDSLDSSSSIYWEGTEEETAGMCYGTECSVADCPSASNPDCPDTLNSSSVDVTNPWINFDGYVIVTPD